MVTTTPIELSNRDHAVLRAADAGRCVLSGGLGTALTIDGYPCSDQFVGVRLVAAGLIAAPGPEPAPARLTPSGRALLHAA
jgi:hypothetical protein